ncbi:MAG: mechanosensitive ion channel family protein [Armatimonadetes bacterium]|nr:mechanosensitive ion channel family protein [Armatimonadota bacterium]
MNVDLFSQVFWSGAVALILSRIWDIAKILIFFLVVRCIAYRLVDRVTRAIESRETNLTPPISAGRVRTLGSLVKSTVFYVLTFISGVMLLRVFNVDIAPVLTAAGVVGLAVGFGAQKLVRDIISGFFIVLENQYAVGDYVTIGVVTGTVEELGMRITRIRDDVGKLIIIANGDIVLVTNHSRGPVLASLEVSVARDTDLDRARSVIDEIGREIESSVSGVVTAPKADGLTAADAAKVTIRVSGEVKPGRSDAVQSALRERIMSRFEQEGIKLV